MKVDLEDLEHKLRQAVQENRVFVAANSPPVTLALIARIRELEQQGRRAVDATGLTVEEELVALGVLLDKCAVVP